MSFVVSGKVLLDGAQAVSELKEVKAAKDGVKKATTDVNAAEVKATTTTKKWARPLAPPPLKPERWLQPNNPSPAKP